MCVALGTVACVSVSAERFAQTIERRLKIVYRNVLCDQKVAMSVRPTIIDETDCFSERERVRRARNERRRAVGQQPANGPLQRLFPVTCHTKKKSILTKQQKAYTSLFV